MEKKHDDSCEFCEVGMFRLPGIVFHKEIVEQLPIAEMVKWANEYKCGTQMTDRLWSFTSEAKRNWFLFRWSAEMKIK